MPDSNREITRADLARLVEQDIAKARATQRDATAAGDHFTADAKGDQINDYLDERAQYDY
jgi:hypothetical protein